MATPSSPATTTTGLDPTAAQTRLDKLQAQLDDLANAMLFALRTNQTVALNAFRGQFRELSRAAAQLRDAMNASEQPPALLQAMDVFSDKAIAVAKETGADASALAKGTAKFLSNAPLLVLGVAVVALVVAAIWFLPRRRSA